MLVDEFKADPMAKNIHGQTALSLVEDPGHARWAGIWSAVCLFAHVSFTKKEFILTNVHNRNQKLQISKTRPMQQSQQMGSRSESPHPSLQTRPGLRAKCSLNYPHSVVQRKRRTSMNSHKKLRTATSSNHGEPQNRFHRETKRTKRSPS